MSATGERWFERNSFDKNYDMTEKLLKKFDLNNYHFVNDNYGNLALIITNNLKKYRLEIYQKEYYDKDFKRDETESYMIIKRCEVHRGGQKHPKEYMIEKKRIKEDCIWNSIKWVKNNSKIR